MGCSTAKIFRSSPSTDTATHGRPRLRVRAGSDFEAFGMPLNVLVGGAPAMVGALWDVLGGDLEQLVCSLLKGWVTRSLPRKRSACNDAEAGPISLMGALVKAREACRLRFLTGAAVVCYGIPI